MENILKTIFLLGILSVIFIFIGGFFGGTDGIIIAFLFSLVINGSMYFFSDKLALSMSGAKPLDKNQYPQLYRIVKELSHKMNIPMPRLFITPSKQANAFATGRDPHNASVAVTEGILDVLSEDELRGVLAHELSHVKNRDILVASIAAVMASAISFIGNMALFGGSDDEDRGGGAFAIVAAILLPIAASLIQLAISRQREFGADESGAKTIGNGKHLAQALIKIHDSTKRRPVHTNPALSSLYIENPLGSLRGLTKLFSTHPPVEERVRRLEKI